MSEDVTLVYWRDIPAQVIVGKGRRAAKVQLPERFEQAIDRCAMKIGAKDADAYLAEWHKMPAPLGFEDLSEGSDMERATAIAARIDETYPTSRLKSLIDAEGYAPAVAP